MKSWLTSKTLWFAIITVIGGALPLVFGYIPAEYAGYVVAGIGIINAVLRVVTKGALSISLPGSVPAIPPVLQAAIEKFEQTAALLPPDFAPRAFQLIEQAATGEFADNTVRFNYVLGTLKAEFPGVGTNLVRDIIEKLVLAKNQGVKPTLAMTL